MSDRLMTMIGLGGGTGSFEMEGNEREPLTAGGVPVKEEYETKTDQLAMELL